MEKKREVVVSMKPISTKHDSINGKEKFVFSQDIFQLAYHLVSDAASGRVSNFERSVNGLKYYRIYLSFPFRCIRILFHLTMIILLLFDTANRDAKSMTANITISVECTCLCFYIIHLVIVYKFTNKAKFYRDKKHYIIAFCVLVSIVDVTLFMCQVYQIRVSPIMRVVIFVNSSEQSQIRRHLRTLMMTLVDILVILPFLLTFYAMMVAFIYKYFKINSQNFVYFYDGRPYMESLLEIVWDTIVYITSANSPDIMLPAFSKIAAMGIFFLLFYAVFFFLLIFIYGLIMSHLRNHAKEEMKRVIIGKLSLVYDSFILLTESYPCLEKGDDHTDSVVTKETWNKFMKYFPKYKDSQQTIDILFRLLSGTDTSYLTKCEFMKIADLFSIPLTVATDSLHFFEKYLWFSFSNRLVNFIEGRIFRGIVAILIVINFLCITFTNERYIELLFSTLFLIEIFLRIYISGFKRFFNGLWNIFDFILITLAFIFWFVEYMRLDFHTITFTLLVLRNLRLLKLLRGVSSYLHLLHILGMLLPTIMSLLVIVISVIVVYVCIGTWAYHGLFSPSYTLSYYMMNTSSCNKSLPLNSDFGKSHYCILSFNSFISGLVMLCAVAVGNNWHTLAEGYAMASGHLILSRIYFSSFKVTLTYLLLLIVAFVLDVFLLAYKQRSCLLIEESVNQKLIDMGINFISFKDIRQSRQLMTRSDKSSCTRLSCFSRVVFEEKNKIWFRIKVKGARSVEYVSQAMFQSEIETEMRYIIKYKHFFE